MKKAQTSVPIIFMYIGWMKHYKGLNGDKITSEAKHVKLYQYGHEIYNFLPYKRKLYGFVQTPSIRLERLGASHDASSLQGVLVVWTARDPRESKRFIVGWYQNATVYRKPQEGDFDTNRSIKEELRRPAKDDKEYAPYLVSASEGDCTLLSFGERKFEIPFGKGGGKMGQSCLWYADSRPEWKADIIKYIQEYKPKTDRKRWSNHDQPRSGVSKEHEALTKFCAENPTELGLSQVKQMPGRTDYEFLCGDRPDVVFEMRGGKYAVLEIETDDPEPGFHQALKYRTLMCAHQRLPLDSRKVRGILVAWNVSPKVRRLCKKYAIEFFERKI